MEKAYSHQMEDENFIKTYKTMKIRKVRKAKVKRQLIN